MKTKQLIIPTVAFILALTALFYSHYAIATAFFLYLAVNLFIEVRDTISQLTSKLTGAEVQVFMQRDEIKKLAAELDAKKDFEESQRVNQFELLVDISDLKTQLETAKANSYTEIERKRGREKYNRLYKGKKKSEVATEQKREPNKIEPFRMVVNPKQSAIVQQILFDNGYAWASEDKEILYTYAKNLFLEESITFEDNIINLDEDRKNLPKLSFRKFMSMYGKKQEPYTIEGKTIKQLVEENLGVIVKDAGFAELKSGEICGFSAEYAVIGINDSSGWDKNYLGYDILKEYTTYWFAQEEQLIYAIKKHRNIK